RDTTLGTAHSQTINGLAPNTTYHFRVRSTDAAGNPAVSGDRTFTTVAADTEDPTVAITAPSSGATVSGTTTVSASATDNVGVLGVQFRLDGAPLGTEDTTTPYAVDWTTATAPNGSHTLTAVARDAAGRTATAAAVPVTVANTGSPGLVAGFGFNEGAGTGFTDSSGAGNNGTLFQTVWSTSGKYGKALSFDGTNDYASVPDAPSLDIADKMTLEAWVRPTVSSGWRTVMLKELGNTELAFAMYSASGTNRPSGWIRPNPSSGGSSSAIGTAAVPLNAWTHLAVTYDGAALKVFVNGTQAVSKPYSGALYSTTDPLRLGGNLVWGEYFKGLIDEVRIYNRPLTAAQIQADMQAPL
ncbi:MAG: LamG-like jellyroll fold domain-containing protein, partial [Nocardioides sp.]